MSVTAPLTPRPRNSAFVHEEWPLVPVSRPPSIALRDYRFIDGLRVDSILAQLGKMPDIRKVKKELGVSATGPKFTWSTEDGGSAAPIEAKISALIRALGDSKRLTGARPVRHPKICATRPPIVYERCVARQYLFPNTAFSVLSGIKALKIWVSLPNHNDFVDVPYNWSGSYLFLTEVFFDAVGYSTFVSGCSALRMIHNAISENPP